MRRMCSKVLIITALAIVMCSCGLAANSGRTQPPTATTSLPTATPSAEQHIIMLVQQAIGKDAKNTETSYDARNQTVSVLATVGQFLDVSTGQERVKVLCFQVQKTLWTSGLPLKQVSVTINGPIYDIYGDLTTGGYGGAQLGAETEAKFTWSALSPDSAWADYNVIWLTSEYNND